MKYLLVLAVLMVAVWIWRNNRRSDHDEATPPKPPSRPQAATASAMVACRHCGLHLPASEALKGTAGVYCCAEHRRQSEG